MPPRKEVQTLLTIAEDKVLFNICAVILEEMLFSACEEWDMYDAPVVTPRMQIVRDILANVLSGRVMENLLNRILTKGEEIEATVRYLALQLLTVEGVNTIRVGHFPESYYGMVLEAIAESSASLERLDLNGLWVRQDDKASLCKLLRRLSNIKFLSIRYVCDDEILSVIGRYCQQLVRLDVAGSANISADGIENLVKIPSRCLYSPQASLSTSLQVVDIGGPGAQNLSVSHACMLLQGLSNLISLGPFENTGAAVHELYKKNSSLTLKLRYIHDYATSSDRMLAMIQACPCLQAVYFDSPGSATVQHLHMFKNMTELKLHRVKWIDVVGVLKKCGIRLSNLTLLTVWGKIDFLLLGEICPSLLRLELHNISMACTSPVHPTALRKVKEILIYNSVISTACFKLILHQGTELIHLTLGQCGELSDAALISCVMDKSLPKLKELWLGIAGNLTMRSIDALLENCPALTSLGNLASWSIDPAEIALLKLSLQSNNIDLTVHEYGPDDDDQMIILE